MRESGREVNNTHNTSLREIVYTSLCLNTSMCELGFMELKQTYTVKKLLLIYSKSDCEYTVLMAVGKCTATSTVK